MIEIFSRAQAKRKKDLTDFKSDTVSLSDPGLSGAGLNAAIHASYSQADVSSDSASASDYGSMTTHGTHPGHTIGGRRTERTLNWNLQTRASKLPLVQNVTRGHVLNLTHGQVLRVISGQVENVIHGQVQYVIRGQVENVTRGQVENVIPCQVQSVSRGRVENVIPGQVQNVTRGQFQNFTQNQIQSVTRGQVQSVTRSQVQNVTHGQIQDVSGGQSTCYKGLPAGSGQAYPVYDVSACPGGPVDVNNSRGIVTFRFEAATSPSEYLCRVYIRVPEEHYINLTFLG